MTTNSPSTEKTLDLTQALWQNRGKMLIVFSMVMIATIGLLKVAKLKYTSEAKLFIRLGKETVGLDPTATVGQTIAVQEGREKEIYSVQSLMQSRGVLEQVVDAVGVERILEETGDDEPGWMPIDLKELKKLSPVYVDSPRDEAIEKLEKGLEIYNPRSTAIIGLRYETISPKLAAEVLDRIIESSVDAHVRIHQSEGSNEFFTAQTQQTAEEVARLEAELLEFKNESGVSELNQHRQVKIAQIASLEDAWLETIAQIEAVDGEIKSRERMVAQQPLQVRLAETTGLPSSAAEGMREQLYSLQLNESEYLSRYQPTHPKVRQMRAQIAAAQETLDSENRLTQVTMGVNESRREMESELQNQQAIAASLAARQEILAQQIADAKSELKSINENEIKFAQISRRLDLARTSYQDYARRSELARMDQALSTESLSNLTVLQSPSASKIPSSPKVAMTLVMGITSGTFLSALVAILAQLRTIHREEPAVAPRKKKEPSWKGFRFVNAATRLLSFRWL
ncbi:GumC family protein [Rhodopirellula sp. SWK7]|uniref:GumC family protein n=1 Tax=Rhodopirellula sp. SWK7 TaxID=595460 RepID=UPI0002BD7F03|nr:LPS biosynthesis protein [Rhodopirellula sp. SWK7]EMI40907.1 lipopolysaccharide biosynthesis protein [Rhodopirellula sp. SWK7]